MKKIVRIRKRLQEYEKDCKNTKRLRKRIVKDSKIAKRFKDCEKIQRI